MISHITNSTSKRPEHGLDLNISKNISSEVKIFVTDKYESDINSIEYSQYFYPQQSGLPAGTVYGFRFINQEGKEIMPVYETFIAKSEYQREIGKQYYHGVEPENYTVQLIKIEGNQGIIVAETNFKVISAEELEKIKEEKEKAYQEMVQAVYEKCGALTAHYYTDCVVNFAITSNNIEVCDRGSMPKDKGFCRAKLKGDWRECQKIECDFSCTYENIDTQKDLCTSWYAVEKKEISICENIKNTEYKDDCKKVIEENLRAHPQ